MRQIPAITVVVSSNTLLREGLARVLSGANFTDILSVPTLDGLDISSLPSSGSALIIVDVDSDFDLKIRQIRSLKATCPTARIAVFGENIRRSDIATALRAGANACFAHVSACDVFIKALELVMLGEPVVQPVLWALNLADDSEGPPDRSEPADDDDITAEGSDPEPGAGDDVSLAGLGVEAAATSLAQFPEQGLPALSPRQHFILRCLVQGDSNKLIARKIAVSEGTVKAHLKVLLRKMKVRNRTQAAIWALSHQSYLSTVANDGEERALAEAPGVPTAARSPCRALT